ncbi:acetate non-utilizing protein 9, mitochondrial [Spathaspora passalidarum NRRL Y-27907]|uniref:Succinate dehydrogenase assembly factor 3 n=1 Tax=Spathaspora passalidarum (strain NRRL Y-27907 / 11-Y1) TaxID=619300 RepID=G3ATP1_SPAPN|nr:acetate non-utilizing protein 9, mitochondrial [Spathaspora passalidarum NRRL Y-27907]EGW30267.1 acetate non-utilizing protein 9, mitochondrial [Spathaspora passalidarum NRRL Y-27907]
MRSTAVRLVRQRRPTRNESPLLPPLVLYRSILRAHVHKLPKDLRSLGDHYVKDEFKAHKKIDNPLHIVAFLTQWQDYLRQIDHGSWLHNKLKHEDLEKMSPDQIGQLYELMKAAKRVDEDGEHTE